jgi:hypothetical protein
LTGYAEPDSGNRFAALFWNRAVTLLTIDGALTDSQLAPGALHGVFNARVNLILNGAIP